MSISAQTLLELAELRLEPEQMAGVLRILANVQAKDEERRQGQRERTRKHREGKRDGNVTVTSVKRDTPSSDKEKSPTPPKEINSTHETSSLRSDVCPEPEKSAPVQQSPAVIDLPSLQGQTVTITEADVSEWVGAFPAVDVRQQLRSMRQWLLANERQRKTPKGMRRFVVSWLSREQDRGAKRPTTMSQPPPRRESEFARHQRECTEALERSVFGEKRNEHTSGNNAAFDLEPGDWRTH